MHSLSSSMLEAFVEHDSFRPNYTEFYLSKTVRTAIMRSVRSWFQHSGQTLACVVF